MMNCRCIVIPISDEAVDRFEQSMRAAAASMQQFSRRCGAMMKTLDKRQRRRIRREMKRHA